MGTTGSLTTGVTIPENSYATLFEAETYFATYYDTESWVAATNDKKQQLLNKSKRILDSLNFDPEKIEDFASDYAEDVKSACIEIAIVLIDVDPDEAREQLNVTSEAISSVRTSYDRSSQPVHILAGVPSYTAWRLICPYLKDPRTVHLARVT